MKNNKMVHVFKVIFNFPSISACILLFHLTETSLWKVLCFGVLSTKCVQLLVHIPRPHSVTLVNNCMLFQSTSLSNENKYKNKQMGPN